MTEEQLTAAVQEGVRAGLAANRPPRTNLLAMAAVAVALLVPLGGWEMSLANRVAVLEAQSVALQSASVEIAAMKQQITDFRNEFDEWKHEEESRNNGK